MNIDLSRLKAEEEISKMVANFPKAKRMYNAIRKNIELRALWDVCNYMSYKKLLYTDHGPIHAFVTAQNALKIARILQKKNIATDLIRDKRGDWDDVFLVIITASLFHDIGNAIHRDNHWLTALIIIQHPLEDELRKIYGKGKAVFFKTYIFDCIYSHERTAQKVTAEASIVGLGDYTDITKGRSAGILGQGKYNIHTISSAAIQNVIISPGQKKPVRITVELTNSSGIFQVEESLTKNLLSGVMRNHVEIIATVIPKERKSEEKIISTIDALEQNNMEHGFGI